MSTNPILSKHEDVVELATKIGQDIGGVTNLQTTNKTSVVGAINEVLTASVSLETSMENDFAKKTDLTPLAKKTDLTPLAKKTDLNSLATKTAVAKDIGVLADLQTTNKTSVVSAVNEVFTAINSIDVSLGDTFALKSELAPLATKAEVAEGIYDIASELSESIEYVQISAGEIYAEKSELTPLATKADVSKDIGNLANLPTDDKTSVVASINELLINVNTVLGSISGELVSNYAKKSELTPLATKTAVAKDIGNLANLPTDDKTSVVASINELLNIVNVALGGVNTSITNINTELDSNYAKKSELTPLATKTAVAKDIGVVTNLQTTNKTNLVAAINELKTADTSFTTTYAKKSELTPLAKKTDLTPLATKVELTQAITNLINGADADSDTLKELADKITALAQADNGLVSAVATQTFTNTQKQKARDNIGAISEADVNGILEAKSDGGYVSAYLQASQ